MNNLPPSNLIVTPSTTQSSLLLRFYDLPISRKTNLIPWFGFGGLLLVLGAGGLIEYGTLKAQLLKQAESRLEVKSQVIKLLLAEANAVNNLVAVEQTLAEPGYSAVYLLQADEELALASSLANFNGENKF